MTFAGVFLYCENTLVFLTLARKSWMGCLQEENKILIFICLVPENN
jgi:hypothetical protein